MAHEIASMNGRAQMAYVGAAPWHTLGTLMTTPPRTVAEALTTAQMAGWDVKLERCFLGDGRPVDSWAAIRPGDGAILGCGLGSNYRIVQIEQAFAAGDPIIRSGNASVETVGALKGGSKVWMLFKLNKPDSVIVAKSDDRVAKYLLIATSFDGSISVMYLLTGVRVVCQNTLSMALGNGGGAFKIRHTAGATDALDAVKDAIERADVQFEKVATMFRALAGVQVTEAQVRAYIDVVFPAPPAKASKATAIAAAVVADAGNDFSALLGRKPNLAAEMDTIAYASDVADKSTRRVGDNIIEILERGGRGLDLPGVKGTAWGAYNAVTDYLSHERGRSSDNRMHAVWFSDVGKRALTAAANTFLS